ncbi:hypothetical protein M422DRAFT_49558 [Sphaerobolus stellatus SS14]|uniref:Uncharacterized protein n=1 Tax=Sphaerobolus stellatus (strain SS14) TaxID=990650 RepID=A0A0C9UXC6_SPHS4|nr:hypothetical protein M422DRAFT_49558 [Sphaerobolus stellatus SS14]
MTHDRRNKRSSRAGWDTILLSELAAGNGRPEEVTGAVGIELDTPSASEEPGVAAKDKGSIAGRVSFEVSGEAVLGEEGLGLKDVVGVVVGEGDGFGGGGVEGEGSDGGGGGGGGGGGVEPNPHFPFPEQNVPDGQP